MPTLTLTVGGRGYKIACGEGEEVRVRQMGEAVEAVLSAIPASEHIGEIQRLFLTALSLADSREEARRRQNELTEKLAEMESRIEQMGQAEAQQVQPGGEDGQQETVQALEAMAARIEALVVLLAETQTSESADEPVFSPGSD